MESSCPRFLYVRFNHGAGLGNRVADFVISIAYSLALNISLAFSDGLETCVREHGCYPDAESVLGLSYGLTKVADLKKDDRFEHVDVAIPVGTHKGGPWFPAARSQLPLSSKGSPCFMVYRFYEHWPRDYGVSRWFLSSQFERAFASAPAPIYDPQKLAIAIHLRYGNIDDTVKFGREGAYYKLTLEEWLKRLLGDIRKAIEDEPLEFASGGVAVPYHVYVFTGGGSFPWLDALGKKESSSAGLVTVIRGSNSTISAANVMRHLATADITICGPSSMCTAAILASTRSLSFVANARESFFLTDCPAGIHCVEDDGALLKHQKLAVWDALDRWRIRRHLGCPPVWSFKY